ncbi:MAG: DUF4835 family protein [Bacteroidales bacterium]|nr:DUF4835 family protein [Candidatus Physcousia equi]
MHRLLSILFISLFCSQLRAQELEVKVTINHAQVGNTTKTDVFEALQEKMTQFLNEHQWTNLQFQEKERIKANLGVTVNTYSDTDNSFKCAMTLTVSRPVWGSNYTTTSYSVVDKNFDFTFLNTDQLEYAGVDNLNSNLVALMAYYAYMIIGYDMDTMQEMGGTPYFQQAEDIVTNAENLGYTGWKAFGDSKNRFALLNDYLDGSMEPYRQLVYRYHRQGLDQMAEDADGGRTAIYECMDLLDAAHKAKSMSQLPQLFSEYKREELLSVFKGKASREECDHVYDILFAIDPSQSNKWDELKR